MDSASDVGGRPQFANWFGIGDNEHENDQEPWTLILFHNTNRSCDEVKRLKPVHIFVSRVCICIQTSVFVRIRVRVNCLDATLTESPHFIHTLLISRIAA